MPRPLLPPALVLALALTVLIGAGCGGGGKGGSSSSGGDATPSGTIVSQQIVGNDAGSTVARSLVNLQVGEKVTLRSLALYADAGGAYSTGAYVAASGFSIVADPGVATLSGKVLSAVGPGSGTVTLTGANGTVIGPVAFTVSQNTAIVSGRVRTVQLNDTDPGVPFASVQFLNSTGSVVATSIVGPGGYYRAYVPTSAVTYQAVFTSPNLVANAFYNQFTYGSLDYTSDTAGCGVALGTLSASSNLVLGDSIAYSREAGNVPPPPPGSGCLAG